MVMGTLGVPSVEGRRMKINFLGVPATESSGDAHGLSHWAPV